MLLASCTTTKYVEVEKQVAHDVYHNIIDTVRDSVYNDVYHNVYVKGDTVHDVRVNTMIKYKYISKRDTVIVHDTIAQNKVTETVTKTEEPLWQRVLKSIEHMALTVVICVGISIVYILVKYIKAS